MNACKIGNPVPAAASAISSEYQIYLQIPDFLQLKQSNNSQGMNGCYQINLIIWHKHNEL